MKLLILILILCTLTFAQKHYNKYDDYFRKYTKRFWGLGYDWKYFKAQSIAESNLLPDAVSKAGARGIMQIMPSTFSEIESNIHELKNNIDDAEMNIAAGIYHDRQLYKSWHYINEVDRMDFTFASYNAGRGTIKKAQLKAKEKELDYKKWYAIESIAHEISNWNHHETINYLKRIEYNYQSLNNLNMIIK